MADYIDRDAALALLKDDREVCADSKEELKYIREDIRSIQAADVVEVVRCKDCKHRDPEDHKCDCGQLERAGCIFPVADDYFCAYGVKNDG